MRAKVEFKREDTWALRPKHILKVKAPNREWKKGDKTEEARTERQKTKLKSRV